MNAVPQRFEVPVAAPFSLEYTARVLQELSTAFGIGLLPEREFEDMPADLAIARISAIGGIGPWSARYGLLRGLGRLDVFPSGDAGAARALGELLGRSSMMPEEADQFASEWKDYAGMLYFHLLGKRYLPEPHSALALSRVPVQLPLS